MRISSSLCHQGLSVLRSNATNLSAPSFHRLSTFSTRNQNDSVDVKREEFYDAADAFTPPLKEKLPKRDPFVKNFFVGKCDKSMLDYPEILFKERHDMFQTILGSLEDFFKREVDSGKIASESRISPTIMRGLKDLGLFGMDVPAEHGGLALSETEVSRLYEVIGKDMSIYHTISAHQTLGVKTILRYGTEAQKKRYLPRLATGEWTAAFALTEENSGSDVMSLESEAFLSEDEKHYILNGKKLWVSNGGNADIFIVFSRVKSVDPAEDPVNITGFIVERNFGGVTSDKSLDMIGLKGTNVTGVQFDNTSIPIENVLLKLGEGSYIAMEIQCASGSTMGSACAGSMKELMRTTLEHAVVRKQFERPLSDFGLIRKKLARMAMDIYAIESMVYLTTGLNDLLDGQDTEVEQAIVKVFSSEKMLKHTSECLEILGGKGLLKGSPCEQLFRDCRALSLTNGSNDVWRLDIALSSLSYAGDIMSDEVMKLRNPFMFPWYVLKERWRLWRAEKREFTLDLKIQEKVHPSLIPEANQIEYAVKKLEYAVSILFVRKGTALDEPENQQDVQRLADIAIDLYAMVSVLSRASRSYCIGLHNSDHEVEMAKYFCMETSERIKRVLDGVLEPDYNRDFMLDRLAKSTINKNGYAATHPMTRVFW